MKKYIRTIQKAFILLLSFGVISAATAQELQKDIFGMNAGMNISSISISGTFLNIEPSSKLGFRAGVSYQRLLLSSMPLYLETGIYFSQKGMIQKEKEIKLELSLSHIQVPLLVNYHVKLGSAFAIVPAIGIYYSYGINGNYTFSGTSDNPELNYEAMNDYVVYGDKGELKRSNLGLRVGVGFDLKHINLTFGYERDILNTSKIEDGVNDNAENKNKMLTLSVGYCFK